MSSQVVFEFTRMKAAGKNGTIKPDASGYYDVILGAFNIHNASKAYYPFNEVKNLFTKSSDLMERVGNGQLYGEWGHPKPDPGMSDREYLIKLLTMHEEHTATTFVGLNWMSPSNPQKGECVWGYGAVSSRMVLKDNMSKKG